uniref:Uncharacterized protein n=1 Tax=Strigamia maritima TaxID=126957 RepID=T1J188_STRMM
MQSINFHLLLRTFSFLAFMLHHLQLAVMTPQTKLAVAN